MSVSELVIPGSIVPVYPKEVRPGCVLNMDMQDTGNKIIDHSVFGNNGVNYGSTPIAGLSGWTRKFDGVDDYVAYGNGASLNINREITIEVWVKRLSASGGYIVAKKTPIGWTNAYAITFSASSDILTFVGDGAASIVSNSIYTGTDWMHIVVVAVNGGTIYFYKNGNPAGSGSTPTFSGAGDKLLLGARQEGSGILYPLFCLIGEACIYNRALSAAEIAENYAKKAWRYGLAG